MACIKCSFDVPNIDILFTSFWNQLVSPKKDDISNTYTVSVTNNVIQFTSNGKVIDVQGIIVQYNLYPMLLDYIFAQLTDLPSTVVKTISNRDYLIYQTSNLLNLSCQFDDSGNATYKPQISSQLLLLGVTNISVI